MSQPTSFISRSRTQIPTWLYVWHLLVFLAVGVCIGVFVGWMVR